MKIELQGKKTYIIAVVWGIALLAANLGFITPETLKVIEGLLIPAGLAALRAGITKSGNEQ